MTTRIYYTDPRCRRFDAVVTRAVERDSHPAVVLDRTAFYPSSGGQPFDTGRLGLVDVVDVVDEGGEILHVLSAPIGEGTPVGGEIDWPRRFDHMQQHTGQHLLSAAFDRLFENRTVSFHMGVETATIDLARVASWDQIGRAEAEANRIVCENREVSIRFVDPARGGLSGQGLQLRKPPSRAGVLRLIEVSGFDLSACGGTHVGRTGAIGMIAVAGSEKFKGGARITFACGDRALQVYANLRDAVAGSVKVLSVLPRELPGAIERLQRDMKDLRRANRRFQDRLAAHEAARLVGNAPLEGGVRVVVEALDGWDAAGLKAIATGLVEGPGVVAALFSTASPHAVAVARSAGVPVAADDVLRVLVGQFGGRGGGAGDLAQGGGLTADLIEIMRVARTLLVSKA